MNNFIKKYINNISIDTINDFALKNNCLLSKKELNTIYNAISHYEVFLDEEYTKNFLLNNFSYENYQKIFNLYLMYKEKYKNYL